MRELEDSGRRRAKWRQGLRGRAQRSPRLERGHREGDRAGSHNARHPRLPDRSHRGVAPLMAPLPRREGRARSALGNALSSTSSRPWAGRPSVSHSPRRAITSSKNSRPSIPRWAISPRARSPPDGSTRSPGRARWAARIASIFPRPRRPGSCATSTAPSTRSPPSPTNWGTPGTRSASAACPMSILSTP